MTMEKNLCQVAAMHFTLRPSSNIMLYIFVSIQCEQTIQYFTTAHLLILKPMSLHIKNLRVTCSLDLR